MATLAGIGVNLLTGTCVMATSFLIFGMTVQWGRCNDSITPRIWARPKEILHNVLAEQHSYWYGWIPWTLSLSYRTLLEGIPGTGTRSKGKRGPMLNCTVDGIVLIRMQELGLKVSFLATILCLGILLPLNLTSGCEDRDPLPPSCLTNNLTSLTNYHKTTLAFIPSLERYSVTDHGYNTISYRLYAVVAVAWIINIYTCVLLWGAWVENLALRRVFYLEHDHWEARMEELELLGKLNKEDNNNDDDRSIVLSNSKDDEENENGDDEHDSHTTKKTSPPTVRPPYLPHPELRELVPNISLYSVLYRLPPGTNVETVDSTHESSNDFAEVEESSSTGNNNCYNLQPRMRSDSQCGGGPSSSIEHQLQRVIKFFDRCVPNQPGYSSSVAALTVLPDAQRLNFAWKKWYKCSRRLRRLRFIKSRILLLTELEEERNKQDQHNRSWRGMVGYFNNNHNNNNNHRGSNDDDNEHDNEQQRDEEMDIEKASSHQRQKTHSGWGHLSLPNDKKPSSLLNRSKTYSGLHLPRPSSLSTYLRSSTFPQTTNSSSSISPTGGEIIFAGSPMSLSPISQLVDIPEDRSLSSLHRSPSREVNTTIDHHPAQTEKITGDVVDETTNTTNITTAGTSHGCGDDEVATTTTTTAKKDDTPIGVSSDSQCDLDDIKHNINVSHSVDSEQIIVSRDTRMQGDATTTIEVAYSTDGGANTETVAGSSQDDNALARSKTVRKNDQVEVQGIDVKIVDSNSKIATGLNPHSSSGIRKDNSSPQEVDYHIRSDTNTSAKMEQKGSDSGSGATSSPWWSLSPPIVTIENRTNNKDDTVVTSSNSLMKGEYNFLPSTLTINSQDEGDSTDGNGQGTIGTTRCNIPAADDEEQNSTQSESAALEQRGILATNDDEQNCTQCKSDELEQTDLRLVGGTTLNGKKEETEVSSSSGTGTTAKEKRCSSVSFSPTNQIVILDDDRSEQEVIEMHETETHGSAFDIGETSNASGRQMGEEGTQSADSSQHSNLSDIVDSLASTNAVQNLKADQPGFRVCPPSPPSDGVEQELGNMAPAFSSLRIVGGKFCRSRDIGEDLDVGDDEDDDDSPNSDMGGKDDPTVFTYEDFHKTKANYCQELGFAEEYEMNMFVNYFGVEQLSVYAREFAQSAGNFFPYGYDELIIRMADLEKLKAMVNEAEEDVREAHFELIQARANVNRGNAGLTHMNQIGRAGSDGLVTSSRHESMNESPCRPTLTDKTGSNSSGLRQRSFRVERSNSDRQWERAKSIVIENQSRSTRHIGRPRAMGSGTWRFSLLRTWRKLFQHTSEIVDRVDSMVDMVDSKKVLKRAASLPTNVVNKIYTNPTYVVVTFTSRQAAIAARQCQADGCGADGWKEVKDIPTPPLADAAPMIFWSGRGIMRPVTLTINDNRKMLRRNVALIVLFFIYFFYTWPLALASSLLSEDKLDGLFNILGRYEETGIADSLAGIIAGSSFTLFMSVCPYLFKSVANFQSGAHSVGAAEDKALQYYWVFMLLTAFTATNLTQMVQQGLGLSWNKQEWSLTWDIAGLNLGQDFQEVLRKVAKVIPTQMAATWINWIVVRTTLVLPLTYLVQCNTFIFSFFKMHALSRKMRGGGPGGPVPFRIYVDSGVVFLCIVALAPASPLVAPAVFLYFLLFVPMIRWLLIFVYRPDHDAGGRRWPFIFGVFISSMIVGQILLATMMVLKQAPYPAFCAGLPIIPTYLFSRMARQKFLRAFEDAGLMQTSNLDGWDLSVPTSYKKREEYRQWLVDCHKASYVPVCLAGVDNSLTAEPAVVVPTEHDTDQFSRKRELSRASLASDAIQEFSLGSSQLGATFRRVPIFKQNNTI